MTLQSEPSRVDDRLWCARECWQFLGIGQTAFYEVCAQDDFPDAVKIGRRSVRWYGSEVRAFVERQRVKREPANAV